jgi:ABC-2 type transport system ATP-binding protein
MSNADQRSSIDPSVHRVAEGDYVVALDDVSKLYILHKQKPYLIHEVFHRLMGSRQHAEQFWALKDVTVRVRQGEAVAFMGRNGAGKSTALGLVAGAVYPTAGRVRVKGRVGALLELGAGFHPDLTGRENIYLNASLLGLSKEAIEQQFHDIVAFSELDDFIDVPLKTYSSGMHVRLGFSVAIHVDPDLLLMDEALAVGDQAFASKCKERIRAFKNAGKTLLFVSHDVQMVESLCNRAIWLEHGQVRMDGPAEEVAEAYAAET